MNFDGHLVSTRSNPLMRATRRVVGALARRSLAASALGALALLIGGALDARAQNQVVPNVYWRSFNSEIEVRIKDSVRVPGPPPNFDSLRLSIIDNGAAFCDFAIGRPGTWQHCVDLAGSPDIVRYTNDFPFVSVGSNVVRVAVDGIDAAHVYSTRKLRNVAPASARRQWLPRYIAGPSTQDAGSDGAIRHCFNIHNPIDSVTPAIGGLGIGVCQSVKANLLVEGGQTRGVIDMCWAIKNQDAVAHSVGLNVSMDLWLGNPPDGYCPGYIHPTNYSDNTPFFVPGDGYPTSERQYGVGTTRPIPGAWLTYERGPGYLITVPRPQAIARGDLIGAGLTPPNRLYLLGGNTGGGATQSLIWNPTAAIGGSFSDDGVVMTWDPRNLNGADSFRCCLKFDLRCCIKAAGDCVGKVYGLVGHECATPALCQCITEHVCGGVRLLAVDQTFKR